MSSNNSKLNFYSKISFPSLAEAPERQLNEKLEKIIQMYVKKARVRSISHEENSTIINRTEDLVCKRVETK